MNRLTLCGRTLATASSPSRRFTRLLSKLSMVERSELEPLKTVSRILPRAGSLGLGRFKVAQNGRSVEGAGLLRERVGAEVTVPANGAEGMIVTLGGRFGGYGLFLQKGKPVFVYNLLDLERVRSSLSHPIMFDGRNLFDPAEMERTNVQGTRDLLDAAGEAQCLLAGQGNPAARARGSRRSRRRDHPRQHLSLVAAPRRWGDCQTRWPPPFHGLERADPDR